MTLDLFIQILHTHLAALESSAWPKPHNRINGPALFLDIADTKALIDELARVKAESLASSDLHGPGCRCDKPSRENSNA